MARQNPAIIARWVVDAGWSVTDRVTAVAVGVAGGADPDAPNGVWGIPGPARDGPGQARDALEHFRADGWTDFPMHRNGRWALYVPIAAAAVATLGAATVARDIPNPVEAAKDTAGAVQDLADTLTKPIRTLAYLGTAEGQERVAKFMLGGALIILGAFIFATRFTRNLTNSVSDKISDIGGEVIAFKLAQGRGAAAPAARTGGSGGGGDGATPPPSPRAERSPWFRADDEPKTTELNPLVAQTRRILGEQEAISKGHAPARGKAKAPPRKLVNPGGIPVTKG